MRAGSSTYSPAHRGFLGAPQTFLRGINSAESRDPVAAKARTPWFSGIWKGPEEPAGQTHGRGKGRPLGGAGSMDQGLERSTAWCSGLAATSAQRATMSPEAGEAAG